MPMDLEKELNKACPACGWTNVWICSLRDCPKGKEQKEARDRYQELQKNPDGEDSGQ